MAVKTISEFKSRLRGGGARPNLFEVDIPDVPFRGRIFKVAGDRTIDT